MTQLNIDTGNLTLETLPKTFQMVTLEILRELRELKEDIRHIKANKPEEDRWMDIRDLQAYHPDRPSKSTIYLWVKNGKLPVHRNSKKLRFLKSEIDTFLKNGRCKTLAEITDEADQYFVKLKRRK
jgi:excisionase family DNA binding protein